MRFISCHDGKLQSLETAGLKASSERAFVTGFSAWDAIAPQRMFARGAVHELLFDADAGQPKFVASLVARAACHPEGALATEGSRSRKRSDRDMGVSPMRVSPARAGCPCHAERTSTARSLSRQGSLGMTTASVNQMPIIWSDPRREVYPPALASLGFDLTKNFHLRAARDQDEAWAIAECLRCRGVGAVIAAPPASKRMSRIEARRLQPAAEHGGSVGILLRQTGRGDDVYAAATRWKVSPMPGERTVQRWTIQLLHGHGGQIGNTVILEWRRETNSVHTLEKLADRPAAETAAAERRRATA
jgi:protein ImuA